MGDEHDFMKTSLLFAVCLALASVVRLHGQSVIQLSAATYNVTEGAPGVAIMVQRTNDLDRAVSVDLVTTDLAAIAGLDYVGMSTNLIFTAGETNRLVTVAILNDGLVEGVKTFRVTLSNAIGGAELGIRASATVRITDNDKGLAFEFATYSVTEDAGSVLIAVTRGDDGNFPVTVDYATTNVTALAGQDYQETSGTLSFAPGETVKLFTVPILNDSLKEADKTFRLTLSSPAGGGVLGSQRAATVTTEDNDKGVQFEYDKCWIRESDGFLTVRVWRGNDVELGALTVDYATTNVTATAGEDYAETSGTLQFSQGETMKLIAIPISHDDEAEVDETFTITLTNVVGSGMGTISKVIATILDETGMVSHRFDRIAMLPDRSVQLTLAGGVNKRFKDFFDLYPIEVSANLVDWTPLVTLQRTNSSTNVLVYTDTQAGTSVMRFYRTATNHLITAMLQPTGPHPVGMVNRWLTDSTRRNRFGISTNGSFMVAIWYPAVPQPGRLPVSFEDPALLRDLAWVGSFIDREPYFVSHAVIGALCATDGSPYPIVLFSPGLGGTRYGVAEKAENLASRGYVVVSIDHFDAWRPAFPDGTVGNVPEPPISPAGFQDRVRDLGLVLDRLANWANTDPVFAGRLDVNRVAAMGGSWGGGVAGEFARVDERCKLAIVHEGYLQNADELVKQGLSKPTLSIYADPIGVPGQELLLFNKVMHDAVWFQIRSTVHEDFGDWYWWSNFNNLEARREAARTINAYTLWFLNKYLNGSTDPMPALADYPRVINFKQK